MKSLDLKKFKKVAASDKSTTLQHPDGHQIQIAHNKIDKKLLKELDAIPMHYAKGTPDAPVEAERNKIDETPDAPPAEKEDKKPKRKLFTDEQDRNYVSEMGQGTQTQITTPKAPETSYDTYMPKEQAPEVVAPTKAASYTPPAATPEMSQKEKDLAYYKAHAGDTPVYAKLAEKLEKELYPEQAAPTPAEAATQTSTAGPAPASVGAAAPAPAPAAKPSLAPKAAPAKAAAPKAAAPAAVTPAQVAEAAPASVAPTAAPPPAETDYQKTYNDYKASKQKEFAQADVDYEQDLRNGHITPLTYRDLYAKKDTLGKVGMLFGMLLSGAGSALSGQENAVLAAMKQEIANDLEAQKQSKGNAQNFLRINQAQQMQEAQIQQMEKQGQLTTAQANSARVEANIKAQSFALMQANRTALHNLVQQVEKMPDGPQKELAKQKLALVSQAVSAENFNVADVAAAKSALLAGLGQGGGQLDTTMLKVAGMPQLAEDIEKKTVPGIPGRATIPIPDKTRERLMALKQYDEKAREYIDFARQNSTNWANLNLKQRLQIANQGANMAANLQSLYRQKIEGGVYKEGEQEMIRKIIPDQPAKWSASFNAIPKVEQTIRDNQNDLKLVAGSVGLHYPGQQAAGKPTAGPQEGTKGVSKSGKPGVFKNGMWMYE